MRHNIQSENMVLSYAQRFFRNLKARKFLEAAAGIPILNTILQPQFNRYLMARFLVIMGVVIPFVGIFRRAYIKNKFNQYLQSKNQSAELEIKESLEKFEIKMPREVDYMVIIQLEQDKQDEEISDLDKESSSKIYNLLEEAQNVPETLDIKWAFLGSRRLFEIIQQGINTQRKQNQNLVDIEFHEYQNAKKQSKVFLLARDGDTQKVIMEWAAGVPLKEINKYIARHKYKKYLQEINF